MAAPIQKSLTKLSMCWKVFFQNSLYGFEVGLDAEIIRFQEGEEVRDLGLDGEQLLFL